MKIKSKILSVLAGLAISLSVTGAALAADCASTTLKMTGILPSLKSATATEYIITVVCNDATPAWTGEQQYVLSVDLGESGYATCLTAASLKQTVYLRVASTAWRSLATLIYLNDEVNP